jgi:hypothetical protein
MGELGGGGVRELDVDVVADIGDGVPPTEVLDFADEVDERVLGAAALGQGQLAAGNLDDDGDEVLGAIELEVIDLHGDGELGDGVFKHERVFKLALFVDGGELAELLVGVVALAITRAWLPGFA